MRVDINERTIEMQRKGAGALADIAFNMSESDEHARSMTLRHFGQAIMHRLGTERDTDLEPVVLELTAPHALSLAQAIRQWTKQPDLTVAVESSWLSEPSDDERLPADDYGAEAVYGAHRDLPEIAEQFRTKYRQAADVIEVIGLELLYRGD